MAMAFDPNHLAEGTAGGRTPAAVSALPTGAELGRERERFGGRTFDSGGPSLDGLSRSRIQRMDALARANLIRTARAQVKRELKSGRLTIDTLLLDPPTCVHTAKVFDLLLAVPRYGRVKANKVLSHCRISPSKTIGGLSERQRTELVLLLRR